ncbi:response regulator [Paenibacillus sp. CF384]|uniref:response regulator transcription factor n=1 Tax=Paenibacillus sp. CF384 TaxID=1884382 RepID=UPI00089AE5A6|nr:response regulator [Paenibacillus sp. CF384]SDW76709.1 two component transcriptional regulator, AraC family [Paenibacillus sp. CF384]
MYRILIVDDERIEREGIQQLIRRNNLNLETVLAENGEAALAIIQQQPIDIIITDIKMPFMDGLELSEHVSKLKPDIHIIIYSAYNDFEFARRALGTNVSSYLLKPIQIPEFLTIMGQSIAACDSKEAERIKKVELLEGYQRGLAYEREKVLMDALNGIYHEAEQSAANPWIHLFLVDCNDRFFDSNNGPFTSLLNEQIPYEYDYLGLNEHQSVLFIRSNHEIDKQELLLLAERIVLQTTELFASRLGLVIGRAVDRLDGLFDVFNEVEQALDYKFFMDGNPILFAGEELLAASKMEEFEVESILSRVYEHIDNGDAQGAAYSIELLFSSLKSKGKLSVIYTKVICSELMKRAYSKADKQQVEEISVYLNQIFKVNSLADLFNLILTLVERLVPSQGDGSNAEPSSKFITTIKKLIEKDYSQDLSLESIAEHVHLTPSYLSFLFKKETGRSLVRYITHVRMEKAVELLTNTNMKIIDISESLGFSNSSYFIQIFRNHHGVSPAKYRESSS